jgi:phage shock protein A
VAKLTMGRAVKRWWRYAAVKLHVLHDEHADPKVQLEQAIQEAREQHRRLTEQAAAVIANQKQAQTKLDRAIDEYDRANTLARQALLLAEQEAKGGDQAKASRFGDAAESSASKVIDLRGQIHELQSTLLQATTQAESAKAAVAQNSVLLEKRLAEREKLLSDLDRAKMHEAMNATMKQLTATVGDDVPTFVEVQRKIDTRLAKAESMSELTAAQANITFDARMIEVEQARESVEAQALLAEMRAEMGLGSGSLRAIEPASPEAAPGSTPEAARDA